MHYDHWNLHFSVIQKNVIQKNVIQKNIIKNYAFIKKIQNSDLQVFASSFLLGTMVGVMTFGSYLEDYFGIRRFWLPVRTGDACYYFNLSVISVLMGFGTYGTYVFSERLLCPLLSKGSSEKA